MSNDAGDVSVLLADSLDIAVGILKGLIKAFSAPGHTKGLILTCPSIPDVNHCFAHQLGFRVRQAYVCRFRLHAVPFDFSRIFSLGGI